MYILIRQDESRIKSIVGIYYNKTDVPLLKRWEFIVITNDIEKLKNEITAYNGFVLNKLQVTKPNQNERPEINIKDRISEKGFEAIRNFNNDSSDRNLGILMTIHNQEEWTDTVFCCGNQRNQMINVLKMINGL